MDKLKGKTILVGKEPGQGRLLVSVKGLGKSAAIGTPGCVPACVSRCRAAEGIAHAEIAVDASGNMVITNMKPQNVTYVNGSEIVSKRVTPTSTVELGKDRFAISLPTVIETAKKLMALTPAPVPPPGPQPPQPPKSQKFNISHLEYVWNDFHDKSLEIKRRQKQQGVYASLPMFFTMGGGAITFVLSFILGEEYKNEIQILSGVLVLIGMIMLVYSFMTRKNDTSLEDLEKISEDFQLRYICPNPECRKFLGTISYKLLKNQLRSHKDQKMYCPRCNCEYVEK